MPSDSKVILFLSISVLLLSLYYIWQIFIVFILIICGLYYNLNSIERDNIQGHGIDKVKTILIRIINFIVQTVPALYIFNNIINSDYNHQQPETMFRQNSWNNKRMNNTNATILSGNNSIISFDGKYTSTPIYKGADLTRSPTIKPTHLIRPEQYSLSETNLRTSNIETVPERSSSTISIPNAAGPLLASTRYNIEMGLLADTQSPGLTSRIVQYNKEYGENGRCHQQQQSITHLPKYNTPGVFPVVNLNKTNQKIVKLGGNNRSPSSVTVRIAPPDTIYSNLERSLILNSSLNNTQSALSSSNSFSTTNQSEINTRSVLDALKEISRKRIHARDDSLETNKKRKSSLSQHQQQQQPVNNNNNNNNNNSGDIIITSKRSRDNDSDTNNHLIYDKIELTPSRKKYKYSDIMSSLSSSIELRKQYAQKRKNKSTSPEDNKQVKLNASTSITNLTELNSTDSIVDKEISVLFSSPKTSKSNKDDVVQLAKVNDEVNDDEDDKVKNFNEGSIVNKNGVCQLEFITNPPEKSDDVFVPFKPRSDESKKKRLASLLKALSGDDWDAKTLTNKFFPNNNNNNNNNNDDDDTTDSPPSTTPSSSSSQPPPPPSTTSILVTSSLNKSEKKHVTFNVSENDKIDLLPPVSLPFIPPLSTPQSSIVRPEITTTSNAITQPISSTSFESLHQTKLASPIPQFTTSTTVIVTPPVITTTTTESKSLATTTTTSLFNFGPKTQPTTTIEQKRVGGFSFDLTTTTTTKTVSETPPITTTTIPKFEFKSPTSTTFTSPFNTTIAAATTGNAFNSTNTPVTAAAPFATSITFGATTTSSSIPFGVSTPLTFTTTSSSIGFGTNTGFATSTSIGFGTNTAIPTDTTSFGTNSTSATATGFGSTNTAGFTPNAFNTNTAITTSAPTAAFATNTGFGIQSSFPAVTTTGFGVNNAIATPTIASPFSSATTSSSATTFGVASPFAPAVTTSSTAFGVSSPFAPPVTTSTIGFGVSSPFAPSVTTTSSSTFGISSPFGAVTTTTTTTPATITTTSTGFTSATPFASGATTGGFNFSTANVKFGQTCTPSAFGTGPPSNTNIFGSSSTTAATGFGVTTNTFGSTAPMFGSNAFGANTTNNAFTFGGNSATPAFGTAVTATATTTTATASAFGSSVSAPVFGAAPTTTTQQQNIFGSNTTFQSSAPITTTASAFNFNTTPKPTAVFAFGAQHSNEISSAAPPAFQFNAQKPPTASAGFNFQSQTPGFGASGGITTTFGNNNSFQPPLSGGMFSIGAGSTAPRPRPNSKYNRNKK